MTTTSTRLTNTGNLLVNGTLDEFTGAPVINSDTMVWLDATQTNSYPGTGTSWTSLTSQANVATLTGAPAFSTTNGGYIIFDGVDDYAQILPPPEVGNCAIATIEMWANIKATGARMLFGFTSYDIYLAGGAMAYNTGNGDQYGIPAANVTSLGVVGNWKHYCFVMYNNTSSGGTTYNNNKIYVNGVSQTLSQVGGTQSGSLKALSGTLTISGWTNNVTQYKANMDLSVFKIYDRELTQAEILQNYNALAGRYSLPQNTSGTAITRTTANTVLVEQFDEVTFNLTSPTIKNLLTYSQQFTAGSWNSSLNIVTENSTSAPDNTVTADRIQVDPSGYTAQLNIPVTVGVTYTFSFWVKSYSGGSGTWGTNWYSPASGHHRTTVPITGNWARQSITFTADNPDINVYVSDDRAALATINDGYVWGAQLEVSSTPTIYQPIAAANTLVNTGMRQRIDSLGTMYVTNIFDEFTGIAAIPDGLVAYYDPAYTNSYSGSGPSLYNLVDGTAATLSGNYSASTATLGTSVSGIQNIRLVNTDALAANNISHIQMPSYNNITTISIWYYQHSATPPERYILDSRTGGSGGWIYSVSIGSNWTTGTAYVNGGASVGTPNWSNWSGSTTGVWRNVTFVASTPFTDDMNIFSRYSDNEAMDVTFGPILVYNRVLSQAENLQNYNAFKQRYGLS